MPGRVPLIRGRPHGRVRRNAVSAFTFVEMLLAAVITAIVASAGAAMVYAASTASTQTRDLRRLKLSGHFALDRIGRTVRQARRIGAVTATAVSLWANDTDGDDIMTLDEIAVIRYDAGAKRITHVYAVPAVDTIVSSATLKNLALLDPLIAGANPKTTVWAEDVESMTLTKDQAGTETRLVGVHFVMGVDPDAMAFQTAASLRAPGDYMLAPDAFPPMEGSPRISRKSVPAWVWP